MAFVNNHRFVFRPFRALVTCANHRIAGRCPALTYDALSGLVTRVGLEAGPEGATSHSPG
ncbi:MAG: hypothetical protein PHQ65_05250 [Bacteroidales bacterium]|nr:hypothetical protein [Bacteroidales bacterium]